MANWQELAPFYATDVSDDALWAVAKNSIRHLLEADEHFKAGKFSSSLASAVLSIEENGKLHTLAFTAFRSNAGGHVKKQWLLSLLMQITAWWTPTVTWGPLLRNGVAKDQNLTQAQIESMNAVPEFHDFGSRLLSGEFTSEAKRCEAFGKAVLAKGVRDGSGRILDSIGEGLFHKLRLQALYVDIAEDGNVLSEPSIISAGHAEFACSCAFLLLLLACTITLPLRLEGHLEEIAEMMKHELVSAKDINVILAEYVARKAAKEESRAA